MAKSSYYYQPHRKIERTYWDEVIKEEIMEIYREYPRAQLEMGINVSKEVTELKELTETIKRSLNRDSEWTEYHAETLAEFMNEESQAEQSYTLAATERKALNLWHDGYHEKAIIKIKDFLDADSELDFQSRGWMKQLGARIADDWGNTELAKNLQQEAYAHNRRSNIHHQQLFCNLQHLEIPLVAIPAMAGRLTTKRIFFVYEIV